MVVDSRHRVKQEEEKVEEEVQEAAAEVAEEKQEVAAAEEEVKEEQPLPAKEMRVTPMQWLNRLMVGSCNGYCKICGSESACSWVWVDGAFCCGPHWELAKRRRGQLERLGGQLESAEKG